jgi:hypothetical protein
MIVFTLGLWLGAALGAGVMGALCTQARRQRVAPVAALAVEQRLARRVGRLH